MNKPAAVAAALALVLTAAGLTGCGAPETPHVEGPAPGPGQVSGPVYLSDTLGHPLTRPTQFAVTEFSSVYRLSWRSWGRPKAVATGRVRGMWCIPHCPAKGYPATIEVGRLQRRENVSYYTHAVVRSPHRLPEAAAELGDIHLPLPEP
ncbi:hypothetical protein ACFW81_22310 [Streptomyces angustmyceticus]|uniref:hypothetical protein n=1 Tax=Streptomyces angustmyceticus TaxID=285578 RepID=UPI00368D2200